MMGNVGNEHSNPASAARKWIGEISAERIGQMWRTEDHEALSRTMRAADELTLALMALARREALEAGSNNGEQEAQDGKRTAESLGAEAHAHSD
jgi:hypothetical protein